VPTADNLITFAIEGPAQIIGVGNGDPVSHEPDQFLPRWQNLTIADWRGRITTETEGRSPAPNKQEPLAKLGNWLAPLPKAGEVYDLSGSVTLPRLPGVGDKLGLFLPSLGSKTSVWLNGHELARNLDTSKNGAALSITSDQLVAGSNLIQLIVSPTPDHRNHIPELNRLGALQIFSPAPPWQRQAFNGLAQVILQAGPQPGTVKLTAHAKDLRSATLNVDVTPAPLPPSVP